MDYFGGASTAGGASGSPGASNGSAGIGSAGLTGGVTKRDSSGSSSDGTNIGGYVGSIPVTVNPINMASGPALSAVGDVHNTVESSGGLGGGILNTVLTFGLLFFAGWLVMKFVRG